MNVSKLQFESKDIVKAVTLALMLQGYYYATTGKIETMLVDSGYQKKAVETLAADVESVKNRMNNYDIKLALLYKDADKPKKPKLIETETEE